MNTLDTIRERRAVKHYDTEYNIPKEHFDQIIESTMLSPTSFNLQHWRFIHVKHPDLRKEIREAAWNQAHVTDASLLFVLCADVKAWSTHPRRYWKNAPQEVEDLMVSMIGPFYEGKEELQRDEALRSVGIAAQTMMLSAKALGYDSCPMIGFDAGKVSKIIRLPKNHLIGMMVAIGKGVKASWPKPGPLSVNEVVFEDTF